MAPERDSSGRALKTLEELYTEHEGKVSDKWSTYITEYGNLLAEYRSRPVRLLEIGVQNGGSLEIWGRFFARGRVVVGVDLDPRCAELGYEDPRISVVIGDVNSDETRNAILRISPGFDIIIDDGSHRSSEVICAFARYLPHLAQGGLYLVEDLHCSYWGEFKGGLYHPFSSMAFFKRLADVVNHEHWGVSTPRSGILAGFSREHDIRMSEEDLGSIHSIHFGNSICAVRKDHPEKNRLGARVVAGSEELVRGGHRELSASPSPPRDEGANEWATRQAPPEEELPLRLEELAQRDQQIDRLEGTVAKVEARNAALDEALADRDVKLGALEAALVERNERIEALEATSRERKERIADLEQSLSEAGDERWELERVRARLEAELERSQRELTTERERLGQLERSLASRDAETREMRTRLSSLETRVTALYASRSWRITAPIRWLRLVQLRVARALSGARSRLAP